MMLTQRHWVVITAAAVSFVFFLSVLNVDHIRKFSDTSDRYFNGPQGSLNPSSSDASRLLAPTADYKKSDLVPLGTHQIVHSQSSSDGKYMFINYPGFKSFNPNIIPHPTLDNTWMVVAQKWKDPEDHSVWFTELICNAQFINDGLTCIDLPLIVPIAATSTAGCEGKYAHMAFNIGPHDARVFWGPEQPFIVYGSQGTHNCFGMWTQDFRMVSKWVAAGAWDPSAHFPLATNLQRPAPYGNIEKNWFFFWDSANKLYVHYDIKPHRAFAQLNRDGSYVVADLAKTTRDHDDACLAQHLAGSEVSVHQATNSLRITLCERSDPTCVPSAANTFTMAIIHHQTVLRFHGMYEPYVMLFEQDAPFKTHAFGQRPIWIKGRSMAGENSTLRWIPEDQSEQLYVTSINWKERGLRYHGYLDDIILMGIGVEDTMSAVMDVRASDLIGDLLLCQGIV